MSQEFEHRFERVFWAIIILAFIGFLVWLVVISVQHINSPEYQIRETLNQEANRDYHSKFSRHAAMIRIENYKLAEQLIELLKEKDYAIIVSETISGGNLTAALAHVSDVETVFVGNAVGFNAKSMIENHVNKKVVALSIADKTATYNEGCWGYHVPVSLLLPDGTVQTEQYRNEAVIDGIKLVAQTKEECMLIATYLMLKHALWVLGS